MIFKFKFLSNFYNFFKVIDRKYNIFSYLSLVIVFSSYIYIFSRDKYVTYSEVIVNSSNRQGANIDFQSLISGGDRSKKEDGKYLEVYLKSLEAMQKYDKNFSLIKNYKKKGIDIFNGISPKANREEKLRFYKSLLDLKLDKDYGILRIKTKGYTPESSFNLNNYLIARSNLFINKINKDINKEQLKFAEREAILAKKRVSEASKNLQDYQSNNKLISIQAEIETSSNIISNLETELVNKKVELSNNLTKYADNQVPEILYLEEQIRELEKIIDAERDNIVSPEGRELNKKAAKLDELIADLDFATDLYKTILTSIENSRINSVQNQRFLTILSRPFLPEEIYIQWKHMTVISFALIILIIFNIIKFSKMIIESHSDV